MPHGTLLRSWARTGALDPASIVRLMTLSDEWHEETSSALVPLLQGHLRRRAARFVDSDPVLKEYAAVVILNSYVRVRPLLDGIAAMEHARSRAPREAFRKGLHPMLDGSLWWWDGAAGDGEAVMARGLAVCTVLLLSLLFSHTCDADAASSSASVTDVRAWATYALYHFVGMASDVVAGMPQIAGTLLDQLEQGLRTEWREDNGRMTERVRWLLRRVRRKLLVRSNAAFLNDAILQ